MQLTLNTNALAQLGNWVGLATGFDAAVGMRSHRQARPACVGRTTGPAADLLRNLPRGATLSVQQPLGLEVVCLKGTLWITHDGDPLDHIVESGCSYTAKRGQRMTVHAMADARFIVEPADD